MLLSKNEEIMVYNAGIIIYWPFLTRYFEELGLVAEGRFVDEESRKRAVYLLQFLVYGVTHFPEHHLVLNKILVGMPVEEQLSAPINLTDYEQEVSFSLMNGLIANWPQLANTSIEGMQESFIRREAILERNEEKTTLSVERKGFDVLFQSLPWNINLVDLPWMENPISVNWM